MKASHRLLFVGIQLMLCHEVSAQPVPSREPSSTHIFPAGGRRGETVHVLVGAECIPPDTGFRIWGSGISAPAVLGPKVVSRFEPSPRREPREVPICYPKEWGTDIDISTNVELGTYLWRLTCARGGTGARPFVVGDLPEFIETESNSLPDRAERVELPVTVNGRIAGESDLDYYIFAADAGDVVLCDTMAGRLGSPLDPVIEITDPNGRRVTLNEMRVGSDPILAFRAALSGDYRLLISNVSFHGSPAHVYRMTLRRITDLASSNEPDLLGELFDRGLISSVAAAGFDRSPSNPPNFIALPNESSSDALELEVPSAIRGRFHDGFVEHWFHFHGQQDQSVAILCRPLPTGISTLPELAVLDATGKLLADCKSSDVTDRECRLNWMPPADGEYRIRLRDAWRGARAGAVGYELTLQHSVSDFALRLKSDNVNLMQGGRTELLVKASRIGFDGPIELIATGLPDGVRTEPGQIAANQDAGKLVLVADESARPTDSALQIVGRATVGAAPVERMAMAPHLGRDVDGTSIGIPLIDRCFLTIQHKPVFRLFCNEAYQYAHRGTIYPYAMQIERLDGFNGEITIQLGDRQNRDLDGIEFLEVTVPPGVADAQVPIYLPESMHINVLSQSQIYAQAYARFTDKWGQPQSTLVVSEKRNMIRTMPTVVKLSAMHKTLEAAPGSTIRCKLTLERTSNFSGPVDVELIEPPASSGWISQQVRIEANETETEIAVQVANRLDGVAAPQLRFRARGQLSSDVAVVSETCVSLNIE
jgi:hypothetical protein